MTTRGLYIFSDFPNHPNVSLSIYNDSYLKGAALYFLNMYDKLDPFAVGSPGDVFHRFNKNCEFVGERDKGAQYKYLVYPKMTTKWGEEKPLQIKAYEAEYTYKGDKGWRLLYEGDLANFVNKYAPEFLRLGEEEERLSWLPIVSDRTQVNLLKEFTEKVEPPKMASCGFYAKGFYSLQDAKKIALFLDIPDTTRNLIVRQLQVIEDWYETHLRNKEHNPAILKEAVAIIKVSTSKSTQAI